MVWSWLLLIVALPCSVSSIIAALELYHRPSAMLGPCSGLSLRLPHQYLMAVGSALRKRIRFLLGLGSVHVWTGFCFSLRFQVVRVVNNSCCTSQHFTALSIRYTLTRQEQSSMIYFVIHQRKVRYTVRNLFFFAWHSSRRPRKMDD